MTAYMNLDTKPTVNKLCAIFLLALLVRLTVFFGYVQNNERYCQADSIDYHIHALGIAAGTGMHRPDTLEPLFWRTPGYPAYLAFFYYLFGLTSPSFADNMAAQKSALLMQILICSLLPLLLFLLALMLTNSHSVAWLTAWIAIFHVGFVLASTYLLTDGLALIFFCGFLLCFYADFKQRQNSSIFLLMGAAFLLSVYTWLRPMGQFIALIAIILLLFKPITLKKKLVSITIFGVLFFGTIAPWYIRNYNLTGKLFFCPLLGPYLTVFCAPKIKARIDNISLEKSHQLLSQEGGQTAQEAIIEARKTGNPKIICTQLACLKAALPWILKYPHYFIQDWVQEVIKTTFDLYSYQLVALATNSYKWDPLIEYLPEKIADCLYAKPLPFLMRFICWCEFILSVIVWFGIFGGLYFFIFKPLCSRQPLSAAQKSDLLTWTTAAFIFGASVGMTGGFGYARLRLSVEPLIITLALMSYQVYLQKYTATVRQQTRSRQKAVTS